MASDINEVRERLHTSAILYERGQNFAHCNAADVNALLVEYARLERRNVKLAAAVRGLLNALPSATTHPAIAAARKAVQA